MVSKESLMTSYIFTFAILAAIMTNVCHYFYVHRPRKPDWWGQWAPFVLVSLATALLLISPLKNLVVNLCMQSFRTNGFDHTIETALDLAYMPAFSTERMQVYTGVAYVLMFWGTGLQVDIVGKFQSGLNSNKEKQEDGCPEGG